MLKLHTDQLPVVDEDLAVSLVGYVDESGVGAVIGCHADLLHLDVDRAVELLHG